MPPRSMPLLGTCCDAWNVAAVAVRTGSPFQISPLSCTSLALKVGTASVLSGGFFRNPESFGNCYFLQESQRSCLKPGWVAWKRRLIQTSSASSQPSTTCCLCLTSRTLSLNGPAASSLSGNASSRPGITSQTLVCSRSDQF